MSCRLGTLSNQNCHLMLPQKGADLHSLLQGPGFVLTLLLHCERLAFSEMQHDAQQPVVHAQLTWKFSDAFCAFSVAQSPCEACGLTCLLQCERLALPKLQHRAEQPVVQAQLT